MDKTEFSKFKQELETGLYNKAKKRLFSLLKKNPRDPEILNGLGNLYLHLGDVKKAKIILERAKRFPGCPDSLEKNLDIIKKIENHTEYRYTFLIYIREEKQTLDIWKRQIKGRVLPKNSQYFFLLIKPSPYIISFLKKYKIPAIFGRDLAEVINRGFIEKKGKRVIFIPSELLEDLEKTFMSKKEKFVCVTRGEEKDKIVAFSIDSPLLLDIGIFRKDLGFKEALLDYIKRIENVGVKLKKIETFKGNPIEDEEAKISLCMIVKNEEKNIEKCLLSVKDLVDEIIIVDTGSTDNTPQIAKRLGAKVFFSEWKNDFSFARNESIKYATSPWIFWLDADDYIDEEDKKDFIKFKKILKKTEYMAFRMPTLSVRQGMFEKKDVNYLTRIFRNLPEIKFEGKIHEQVLFSITRLKGKVGTVNIPIYHTGYEDPELVRKKKERNKKILEKALKEEPENPIFLTYLGRTYMEEWLEGRGDIKSAEILLKKAIALFPKSEINYLSYAYLNLSLIYYHMRKFEEAIKYAKEAVTINKDIETAYEVWGRSLLYMNKFEDAEKVFLMLEKNVDRESPAYIKISDFDYKYFLGLAQFNLGKYREAIENFKSTSITQREKENIDFLIGIIYYKLEEYRQAIEYFKSSLKRDPNHYDSWNNMGNAYLALKEYKEAENSYTKALEIREGEEALFSLGYIYYEQGKYEKAKTYFSKVANFSLKRELRDKACFYLANIYFSENDYEKGIRYIDDIENHKDIGKDYYLLKFKILEALNRPEEGVRVLAEALTIYKYDIELMKLFATSLQAQSKIPEAISVWEELVKLERENLEFLYNLGILYAKIGAFNEAIQYFEKILEKNPNDVRIYNDLGVFYGLLGNFEKAKNFFNQALKLEPDNEIARTNLNRIIFEENKENLQ